MNPPLVKYNLKEKNTRYKIAFPQEIDALRGRVSLLVDLVWMDSRQLSFTLCP
jgi:hypothetical protein